MKCWACNYRHPSYVTCSRAAFWRGVLATLKVAGAFVAAALAYRALIS